MLLDRIELFVTAAKHQNLARTARHIHVSSSSVCQRLKLLEKDLGAKLYRRNKEGIELTDDGQTVLRAAGEIITTIENLKRTLRSTSEAAVHSLIIGGTYAPSANYLPSAIAKFQKTHPNIKVTFHTFLRSRIEELLRQSKLDLAVIQSPEKQSDMHMEPLAVDKLKFFVPSNHPLAKKKSVDAKEIAANPFIVREGRGGTEKMLKYLTRRGRKVNVILRCVSPEAVKSAVLQNMGVGILFYRLIEDDVKRRIFSLVNVSGVPTILGKSYIVYSKHKILSSPAADFLAILRSMKQSEQTIGTPTDANAGKKPAAPG